MLRRSGVVWGLVALPWLPAGPAFGRTAEDDDPAARVAAVLEAALRAPSFQPADVTRELVDLGEAALPSIYAAYGRAFEPLRSDPEDPESPWLEVGFEPSRKLQDALLAALARLPIDQVEAHLAEVARGEPNYEEELRALALLGEIGQGSSVPLMLDTMAKIRLPTARESAYLRLGLGKLLIRDPAALAALESRWSGLTPGTRLEVVRAAIDGGSVAARRFLLGRLGRKDDHDAVLLVELAASSLELSPDETREVVEHVRDGLDSLDRSLLCASAQLAGKYADPGSIPGLILLLNSEDRWLRRLAHQSLVQISGQSFPPQAEPWTAWWEEQDSWWIREGAALSRYVREKEPEQVLEWIRELGKRRAFRNATVETLAQILRRPEEVLRAAACSAMAQLGSSHAVPHLRRALADDEPRVRAVALQALQSMGKSPDELPEE